MIDYTTEYGRYLYELDVSHAERVRRVEVLLEPAHFALSNQFIFTADIVVPRQEQGLWNKYHFILKKTDLFQCSLLVLSTDCYGLYYVIVGRIVFL